jgi:hypothetical protein
VKLTPIQIIGIIIVVNGALIGSTAQLTDLLGPLIAKDIVSVASIGNSIFGGVIMMLSGQGSMVKSVLAMPGIEHIDVNSQASPALATLAVDKSINKIAPTEAAMDKVVATAKAAAVVLCAIMLSAMLTQTASAAAKPAAPAAVATPSKCALIFDPLKLCGVLTGNIQTDVPRVVKRIAAINKADLNYAMAKARAAGTPAGKTRLQCIQAISDANDQLNGVNLKNPDGTDMVRPDPALVTGIEDVAELVDNLSPQGVLLTSCAGAANMLGMNALD